MREAHLLGVTHHFSHRGIESRAKSEKTPMRDSDDVLDRLERWYAAQCNGDWEHAYGIKLDTLDNPGWSFKVDLADTYLFGRTFKEINQGKNDDHTDFFYCAVKDRQFVGYCPPSRLREVISIFFDWAETTEAER